MLGLKLASISLILVSGTGICQSEHFLDLTKLTPPSGGERDTTTVVGVHGGGPEGGKPKAMPLKVTVLRVDKESYRLGDAILLEVRVENIGKDAVLFPWTVDWRFAHGKVSRETLLDLAISPAAEAGNGAKEHPAYGGMAPAGIYGSTADPKTFITLRPGEAARIRFASKLPRREALNRFASQLFIKASLSVFDGPLSAAHGYDSTAVSESSIAIQVIGTQ